MLVDLRAAQSGPLPDPRSSYWIGRILQARGLAPEAIQEFNRASSIDATFAPARLERAVVSALGEYRRIAGERIALAAARAARSFAVVPPDFAAELAASSAAKAVRGGVRAEVEGLGGLTAAETKLREGLAAWASGDGRRAAPLLASAGRREGIALAAVASLDQGPEEGLAQCGNETGRDASLDAWQAWMRLAVALRRQARGAVISPDISRIKDDTGADPMCRAMALLLDGRGVSAVDLLERAAREPAPQALRLARLIACTVAYERNPSKPDLGKTINSLRSLVLGGTGEQWLLKGLDADWTLRSSRDPANQQQGVSAGAARRAFDELAGVADPVILHRRIVARVREIELGVDAGAAERGARELLAAAPKGVAEFVALAGDVEYAGRNWTKAGECYREASRQGEWLAPALRERIAECDRRRK